MKRFGGWLRLWIVVVVTTFVGTMITIYGTLPQAENTQHEKIFYEQLPPELKKNIIDDESTVAERQPKDLLAQRQPVDLFAEDVRNNPDKYDKVEMPNGHILVLFKALSSGEKETVAKAYWEVIEKITFHKRIYFVLAGLFYWVCFITGLYAMGWSVGWVYRGFKGK